MSQTVKVEGTIERKGFGPGTWAIVGPEQTYELHNPPTELQHAGLKASVEGKIREDVMSFAMVGPILEVQRFDIAR
jgi:hypothetical protein